MKEQEIEVMVPSIQTVKTYRYDELPEESKGSIRDEWREHDYYDWSDEIKSMEAIAKALDCDLGYRQDAWNNWHVELIPNFSSEDAEGLSGSRAMAYIENNFITPSEKGKWYHKWKGGERRSRCTMELSCPFTGFWVDDDLRLAYKIWRDHFRGNPQITVEDFLHIVEDTLKKDLDSVEEDHQTDDYADDMIEANWDNRWYLIDGTDVTDDIIA